jgi:hypothetical protein
MATNQEPFEFEGFKIEHFCYMTPIPSLRIYRIPIYINGMHDHYDDTVQQEYRCASCGRSEWRDLPHVLGDIKHFNTRAL